MYRRNGVVDCFTMMYFVFVGFNKIGGFSNFQSQYMNATASIRDVNSTCGLPRDDAFHILREPVSSDNPWPGTFLHIMFGVVWYFCCDQVCQS